jgi:hypothetical protein
VLGPAALAREIAAQLEEARRRYLSEISGS